MHILLKNRMSGEKLFPVSCFPVQHATAPQASCRAGLLHCFLCVWQRRLSPVVSPGDGYFRQAAALP